MKRGNRTHKSDRPPEINITYSDGRCERRACPPGKTGKRSLKRKKSLGIVCGDNVPRGTPNLPPGERSPVSKLQKSRLGRGLSSLISVSATPVEVELHAPTTTPPVKPLDLGDATV